MSISSNECQYFIMPLSKQLSLNEVSARTGLTYTALCKAIKSGDLRGYQLNNSPNSPFYVSEEDVEEWLENRKLATRTVQNQKKTP